MRTFRIGRSVYSLAYTPDSSGLWVGDGAARVHLWDLAAGTGQPVFRVPPGNHTLAVHSLSVSADGRFVAASSYARVVVMTTGDPPKARTPLPGLGVQLHPALHSVLSPDGNLLAVAAPEGTLVLWDYRDQQTRRVGPDELFATKLAFSPDSLRLAVGYMEGNVIVYDPSTGEQVGPGFEVSEPEVIAFSPDGALLAAATGNEVVLHDATSHRKRKVIRAGQAFVRKLAFHPAGQLFATAGDIPTLSLWDTEGRSRGRFNWEIGKVQALAIAPDGMTAAAGGSGGKVAVWDVEDGKG
jgi:WD40 repeat protein